MPISLADIKKQELEDRQRRERRQQLERVEQEQREAARQEVQKVQERRRAEQHRKAQEQGSVGAKLDGTPSRLHLCKCGCGGQTQRTFCPGHDARYFGWLRDVYEGRTPLEQARSITQEAIKRGEQGHGSLAPRWNVLKGESPNG